MKGEVKLCYECHRSVETVVIGRDVMPGGVEVPKPHKNREGEDCDGTRGEVITGWDIPS